MRPIISYKQFSITWNPLTKDCKNLQQFCDINSFPANTVFLKYDRQSIQKNARDVIVFKKNKKVRNTKKNMHSAWAVHGPEIAGKPMHAYNYFTGWKMHACLSIMLCIIVRNFAFFSNQKMAYRENYSLAFLYGIRFWTDIKILLQPIICGLSCGKTSLRKILNSQRIQQSYIRYEFNMKYSFW